MTPTDQRPFGSRLSVRFAVILALALLPLGFIGIVQTNALEREVQSRSELALMGATLQAAASETNLIGRVRGMVGSLATAVPHVLDDPAACKTLMLRMAEVEPLASVIAFVPTSGMMTCSSVDREFDFSDDPLFQKVRDIRAPYLWINPKAPVAQTSVVGSSHPVYDLAGVYVGYAVITVPHNTIENLRFSKGALDTELERSSAFWTFDKAGTLLTSNLDLDLAQQQLPRDRQITDFVGSDGMVFRTTSRAGDVLTYAVVPIIAEELYLMSSFRPAAGLFAHEGGISTYLPTLLMWLVGLVASGFAAELLVTRHVRTLNRSIVNFAHGDRRLRAINLKNAPAELEELGAAYLSMTESITRSEAELEDNIHQKEVLLREVHHRVKNNLQLISSIMNIQIRSARSGEAKDLLKNLQERMMSLATVHRGLYQTSGLADVRARELIPAIVRQIMSLSQNPERPFDHQVDIDDLRLVPDQAVPLSLLLAEALANALKHAGATREHPGRLSVRLKRLGGSEAVLEVVNSTRPPTEAESAVGARDTGIGSQLIMAFVQQLGGTKELVEAEGSYDLRVTFRVSPLSTAENRLDHQPPDTAEWNPNPNATLKGDS